MAAVAVASLTLHEPFSARPNQPQSHVTALSSIKSGSHGWTSRISMQLPPKPKRRSSALNKSDSESNPNQNPQFSPTQLDTQEDNLGVRAALSMLRFYKREISPLLPNSCRYVPTCSEYSMQAYKKYGVVKGTVLTAWRLCRCNPLGGSGFDPPRWFDEKNPRLEEEEVEEV